MKNILLGKVLCWKTKSLSAYGYETLMKEILWFTNVLGN